APAPHPEGRNGRGRPARAGDPAARDAAGAARVRGTAAQTAGPAGATAREVHPLDGDLRIVLREELHGDGGRPGRPQSRTGTDTYDGSPAGEENVSRAPCGLCAM